MHRFASCLLLCILTAACASPGAEMDPAIEQEAARRRTEQENTLQRQEAIGNVLLNLDKLMDKYVEAIVEAGMHRADRRAHGIHNYLRTAVAKHFDELVLAADNQEQPENRAIAAGALGFSQRAEALDPILNAAHSDDPVIATNAIFGLGILQDRRTPPQVIANFVEDTSHSVQARAGAAWSLFRVQEVIQDPERIYPVWLRLLHDPTGDTDPWLLVQALRGISRSRNPDNAIVVEPLLEHPTPLVRTAAATCLGYLGNRASHDALLKRIGLAETNDNVRLAARKALQALAGNIDRGYDVREWQRVFETKAGG